MILEPILCLTKIAHKLLQHLLVEQEELPSPSLGPKQRYSQQSSVRFLAAEFTSFDIVAHPEGFREFKTVVSKLAGYRQGGDGFQVGLQEHETISLLRHVIIEADEGLACTLYELFDSDSKGKLDLTHLYVLFVLVSAIESKRLLEFQHKFGHVIFDMLATKFNTICHDHMLAYAGLIFDKSWVELQRTLQRIQFEREQPVTYEDYELFMFDCISTEYKTRDIDPRIFMYEYSLDEKKGRYAEIFKKSGKSGLSGSSKITAVNPMHSSSSLKCNLI